MSDAVTKFYTDQLPEAILNNNMLQSPCPFCPQGSDKKPGTLVVFLNRESFFHGYFRCTNRCTGGGFPLHFARLSGLNLHQVPGFDPDREYYSNVVDFPIKNINNDILGFTDKLTSDQYALYQASGIRAETLREMQIGYNGRYLVYPYIQPDTNCYVARCVHPEKSEDFFWFGDEKFSQESFRLFNAPDIEHCENGTLIIVEGEDNLLTLKQLGLPGIAVPTAADLEHLDPQRLQWLQTIFIWVNKSNESEALARSFATTIGYKVRIVRWQEDVPRDYSLVKLAADRGTDFQQTVFTMIRGARAFSPFRTPVSEYHFFNKRLEQESGTGYRNMTTGFSRLDETLEGIHGINIMGGTPKAGKSSFFIQIATEMAMRKLPVIYYDFENGKQKVLFRTLCRLSRLSGEQIKEGHLSKQEQQRLQQAQQTLQTMLRWFRVVNDRKLTPETMRRHIDFLRHETHSDYTMVIIDSLHKLPFKDLSERRTGIDGWLRQLEAIRDELQVSFLVISELTRGPEGQFDQQPHLGSFKGSGDIGYSADNAMILMPKWDPFDEAPPETRLNDLWLVASREKSPGRIASYRLDYPYWGFAEEA